MTQFKVDLDAPELDHLMFLILKTEFDRARILAKPSIGNDGHTPIIECELSQNYAPKRQKVTAFETTLRCAPEK